MYELGNWAGVAYHVGTKSKEKCIEHYSSAYGMIYKKLLFSS
jgi:transcriptional adapter 2-alpha